MFKSGTSGESSVRLVGRGANLPAFSLPIANPPVHAIFINDEGLCIGATYSSGVHQNASGRFNAKSE